MSSCRLLLVEGRLKEEAFRIADDTEARLTLDMDDTTNGFISAAMSEKMICPWLRMTRFAVSRRSECPRVSVKGTTDKRPDYLGGRPRESLGAGGRG